MEVLQLAAVRINRTVGSGAGLLALSVLVFSAAGAVWGPLRPARDATVGDGGTVALSGAEGAEFGAFISFALITGALAVGVGLIAYFRASSARGIGMMAWAVVVALVAAVGFWVTGAVVTDLVRPLPDPGELGELRVGDTIRIVPAVAPGIALLAAPLMAALAYWSAAIADTWEAGN